MGEKNETFLADWLAENISDEQLKKLVSTEDFLAFQNIKNTLNVFEIRPPDLEQNFNAIQHKLASKKELKSPKVISLWRYASVAASLFILFGFYYFFIAQNKIETDFGASKTVTLVDNSKVSINAKSSLSYSNTFRYKRTLQLEGEAFFEVEKGSPFRVETSLGTIRVLGTKFNVIAISDYFEVQCFEGKVQVTHNGKSILLTHGESVRFYKNIEENSSNNASAKPTWISGETSFKNVPMRYVIEQFKKQYNVEVSYPTSIENIKFTGTFTNTSSIVALQTICLPLQLKFTKNSTGKIIISK